FGSNPVAITNFNGTAFFSAYDVGGGRELWRSDGTAVGTVQVKDVYPGPSDGVFYDLFWPGGSLLFFGGFDGVDSGLWTSTGTTVGTVRVRVVGAGSPFAALNSTTVLFVGADATAGEELWRSDGTFGGTTLVKDVKSGPGNANIRDLVKVGGTVYFAADDGVTGTELWRSDGTAVGTVRVTDLRPGSAHSLTPFAAGLIKGAGATVYFPATDGIAGIELWKSDGTTAGTVRVKDINPGPGDSLGGAYETSLIAANGHLYFAAYDGATGGELWTSDGTAVGTVRLTDIGPGSTFSLSDEITQLGGKLVFGAANDAAGLNDELWGILLCGDGTTDPLDETCDSGAANGTDGCCSTTCTVIDGDGDKTCDASDNCSTNANPDQRNTDGVTEPLPKRGDLCDPCPADPTNQCQPTKSGAGLIGATGGSVTTAAGASLTFPAGALSNRCNDAAATPCTTNAQCFAVGATNCGPVSVAITGGLATSSYASGSTNSNLVGGLAEFSPEGLGFAQDVTLTFPWSNPDNDQYVNHPTTGLNTSIRVTDLKMWRNGSQVGTCSGAPGTLCSGMLPCPGSANCDQKTCGQQGCPAGSALCCEVANNRWVLKVRQFSEYASGLDACLAVAKPKLRLAKITAPIGDDKLTFKGTITLPTGVPIAAIEPLTHGLGISLFDPAGPRLDVALAPGPFTTSAGWTVNGKGTAWKYTDKSGVAPGGIAKVSVQDKSAAVPGLVKFSIKGIDGSYAASVPAGVALRFPDVARCAEATFPGCTLNAAGNSMTCK
ncbi:MAG: ELWxxDGT repeat protein, partial [Candidatus Binatia bacterium]